ncbi:hypothetical protein M422DRAFT_24316 [Sphaerobolus stellatus SS14]|nr:hypothetical protein M422DRAFT_24316 [Sphaerobolus stellatus SS14]
MNFFTLLPYLLTLAITALAQSSTVGTVTTSTVAPTGTPTCDDSLICPTGTFLCSPRSGLLCSCCDVAPKCIIQIVCPAGQFLCRVNGAASCTCCNGSPPSSSSSTSSLSVSAA